MADENSTDQSGASGGGSTGSTDMAANDVGGFGMDLVGSAQAAEPGPGSDRSTASQSADGGSAGGGSAGGGSAGGDSFDVPGASPTDPFDVTADTIPTDPFDVPPEVAADPFDVPTVTVLANPATVDAPVITQNLGVPGGPGFSAGSVGSVGAAATAIAGAVKGGPAGWGVAAGATALNNPGVQASLTELGKAISQGLTDSFAKSTPGSPEPVQSMTFGFITDAHGVSLELPNAPSIPSITQDLYSGQYSRPLPPDGIAIVTQVFNSPGDIGGGSSAGGG